MNSEIVLNNTNQNDIYEIKLQHVNFYFGKRASAIKLTQLSNYHNHQYNSEIIYLALKILKLPHAILSKIKHYTVSDHLGAGLNKFPEHHIKKKNLYNAISKFRGVQIYNEFDAAEMLSYLLKQHDINQDYIIISYLEAKTNRYDMALSLFVCIDNNFKKRIVEQTLIKYETQAAYEWIFQCMLKSVDNVSLKVIFTDGDSAVIAAIHIIYLQTQYLLSSSTNCPSDKQQGPTSHPEVKGDLRHERLKTRKICLSQHTIRL
ncbi:hypothetical protein RhiirC2_784889 [Rhizophagus irregularis]|uniref:MULE transposase domain-containing protein n=1 Tax=Rhizophagus irregularis TaxID=588596 RepID=A0A2N1MXJ7_9GLOM|nr:hypothetical protein RhiirC2_784889 [Rhizophagus irregularis]